MLIIAAIAACNPKSNKIKEKSMKEVQSKVMTKNVIEVEADKVWNKLITFGGTEKFVPDLIDKVRVEGKGIGAVRNIYLKGGGEIIEKLTKVDSTNHQMEFIILSTPMPISDYTGIFEVNEISESKCEVIFISQYSVSSEKKDAMKSAIKGFQETFVSNLDK